MCAAAMSATALYGLIGCSKHEPLLRIASNVWPGYELLYLAREKNFFTRDEVKLIEVPSATVCIQSLAAGNVEGAMLTLDEVLTARAEGLELKVVAILDISNGADVVLAHPSIKSIAELKGKRIGVEQSAVGAVMLDALLEKDGLTVNDVETVYLTVNQHHQAYLDGIVDALVTFEPVRTQLIKSGAHQLFDSSEIPGRIIDVLAVLPHVLKNNPASLRKLIDAHFKARSYFLSNTRQASEILAKRLQLNPSEVPSSYEGLLLPDLKSNHEWLDGENSKLQQSAVKLKNIMQRARLLKKNVSVSELVDSRFL
ncbi:MAG: ABC transporter substrate-binding protein [Thioalkalispiraceae bacterium]